MQKLRIFFWGFCLCVGIVRVFIVLLRVARELLHFAGFPDEQHAAASKQQHRCRYGKHPPLKIVRVKLESRRGRFCLLRLRWRLRRFGVRLGFEQQNVTGWCSFFCLLLGGKGKPGLLRACFGVLQTRLLFCFEGVQLRLQRLLETLKGQPNVTKDGKSIRIYCNIGSPDDVHAVQVNDGGGIGLFRSEFLYLNSPDYPTEDQQFEAYKKVLADMDGKEVIIRTLDIGADKQIGYFNLPKEDNPAMGMRALRICLTRPEIFKTQLRALYRASAFGKLGIMFPMVTSVWEVREAKKYCEEVKRDLKAEGIPFAEDVQVGIMIETPAAAIMSDRLAKEVDFFSCGTNDLTQYTLACDRQNNDLGRFYDPHNPAVLRLLKMVTENAHKNGIWVGICGELGADLTLTETFLAIGVDELSVSPRAVLPLRNAVRMTDTRESAPRLLAAIDAEYPETL